ncbi:MAG TPA: TOBE domain-containing protein [bacterium]|nr:TOBE domain-containing protein [bacterium]
MRTPMHATFSGRLWLDKAHQRFLGKGRVELLRLIDEMGSITRAAKSMRMSYKAAWEAVDTMNNLADSPLVVRTRGGAGGGETRLTEYGREVVRMYGVFQEEHSRFLAALSERVKRADTIESLIRRFAMRSSARNQFWGRVSSVKLGAVNSEVVLSLGEAGSLVAVVTNESVDTLDLHEGKETCALIKASFVILAPGKDPIRSSARNCLYGTVSRCTEGPVNSEVTLALKGGRSLTATVTSESVRQLGLAPGVPAWALIKASHVILAVND